MNPVKLQAARLMFEAANQVTCNRCKRDLKGLDLRRLYASGCPDCSCKQFVFDMPKPIGERLQAAGLAR